LPIYVEASARQQLARRSSDTPVDLPRDGRTIGALGLVAWDGSPPLRLRASPGTEHDNVIGALPWNTRVQVIREFPGDWYFVATLDGRIGYVAKTYIKTPLPEPGALLHRVEPGIAGNAISIAAKYASQPAQLRAMVVALGALNGRRAHNWHDVQFDAGDLIWVPSIAFADAFAGAGSNLSLDEFWNDLGSAVSKSFRYIPEEVASHVEAGAVDALESLLLLVLGGAAALVLGTLAGAAIGTLFAGVGFVGGAAIGFEVTLAILNWLGLGMLILWVGQEVAIIGRRLGEFLGAVWNAHGDEHQLEHAARLLASAIGELCGALSEAVILWAMSVGVTKALHLLRTSRYGAKFNTTEFGEWLNKRVSRVRAGEKLELNTPTNSLLLVRNVELLDARGAPRGQFDGIDLDGDQFIEHKNATGLERRSPHTGKRQQSEAKWASKHIVDKTTERIDALRNATSTRAEGRSAPSIERLREIKSFRFVLDVDSWAVRKAVYDALDVLRAAHPDYRFDAEFGWSMVVPPHPDWDER
jgi:hypothetical protein